MLIIRPTKESDFDRFTPSPEDIAEAHAYGIEPSFPPANECVTMSLHGMPVAIGGNCGDQVWFVTSARVWKLSMKTRREFRKLILNIVIPCSNSIRLSGTTFGSATSPTLGS